MESRIRRKIAACTLVTAAFGISLGVMWILWARFHPVYFYTSLAVSLLLLGLCLILVGRRPRTLEEEIERDLETSTAAAGEMSADSGLPRAPVAVMERLGSAGEPPLVVEKATGMAPTPLVAPTPPAYTMKGFTLYERTIQGKAQRFFSKGKTPGAQAIPLPEGHQAQWDAKLKRPRLVPPAPAEPAPLAPGAEPEFEVSRAVAHVPGMGTPARTPTAPETATPVITARPCAAFTSPGIMCSKAAKGDTPYCQQHAKYKGQDLGDVEVHLDRAASRFKPFKGTSQDFVVKTARPEPAPLRLKPQNVEVRLGRPNAKAVALSGSAIPSSKLAPGAPKPVRGLMDRPFEVKVGKGPAPKPVTLRTAREPVVRMDEAKAPGKAPRFALGDNLVVRQSREPAAKIPKPPRFQLADNLRVRNSREAPTKTPKTPRFGLADNLQVRQSREKPAKIPKLPKFQLADNLRVRNSREAPTKTPKTPRFGLADNLEVRTPRAAHGKDAPKPFRPGSSATDFEVAQPSGPLAPAARQARSAQCRALMRDGKRCKTPARANSSYCTQHRDYRPQVETVVMRDTRRRSAYGVGDQDT